MRCFFLVFFIITSYQNDKIGKFPLFSTLRFVKQMFSFLGFWIFCSQFVPFAVSIFSIYLCIITYEYSADFQEEDYDGRRCLYLPCCCSPYTHIVLRSIIRTYNYYNVFTSSVFLHRQMICCNNYKEVAEFQRLFCYSV